MQTQENTDAFLRFSKAQTIKWHLKDLVLKIVWKLGHLHSSEICFMGPIDLGSFTLCFLL